MIRLSQLKQMLDERGHYTTTRNLRRLCQQGEIRAERTQGGQYRVSLEETQRVLDERGSRPAREKWITQPLVEDYTHKQYLYYNTLPSKYGVDRETYLEMIEDQGRKCYLCLDVFPDSRRTQLDHCHETGDIRGILCAKCNTRISYYEDNPELLLRYYEYVTGIPAHSVVLST